MRLAVLVVNEIIDGQVSEQDFLNTFTEFSPQFLNENIVGVG